MKLSCVLSCLFGLATLSFASGETQRPKSPAKSPEYTEELAVESAGRHQKLQEAEAHMHLINWAGIMAERTHLQMRLAEIRLHAADKAFQTKIGGLPLIRESEFLEKKASADRARRALQAAATTFLVVKGYQHIVVLLESR
ncbi:MAG: hypothetical protein FJ271_26550 [Planctomycetes bacterium]|nr:hypothetical protein [Planctomycetota bacterium]